MDDRVVHSSIRLPSRSDDGTPESLASLEERALELFARPLPHRADDLAERNFGTFDVGDTESFLDGVPVADDERGFDGEGSEDSIPVGLFVPAVQDTDDVSPHRVCGTDQYEAGRKRRDTHRNAPNCEGSEGVRGGSQAPPASAAA